MEAVASPLIYLLIRIEWVSIVYFLLLNTLYGVLLLSACAQMRKHVLATRGENLSAVLGSQVSPHISILAPAFEEAATITESVRALLAISYPNLEIIVINDGSRDDTLQVLIEQFELVSIHTIYQEIIPCQPIKALYRSRSHPNLVVADKENGGSKADALNAGLNLATGDLVCAIDADTLIEPDALQRMVRPFLTGDEVLAAGGTIRLVNGSQVRRGRVLSNQVPRDPLVGFQVIEYIRAFLFGRLGWNGLGGNLIISGAFGLFRRDSLFQVGGYAHDTVGEDMEIIVKLRCRMYEEGKPHRVAFIPDPVAWTEAPATLRLLSSQRDRWHRGLADVIWRYRHVFFNRRYGAMGLLVYPYFFFVELMSPVLELVGVVTLVIGLAGGAINGPFAALFFAAAYGYGLLLTMLSLLLEEIFYHRYNSWQDRIWLITWTILENFGYRQLTVLWRLWGLVKFIRGERGWGTMERRGFALSPNSESSPPL